MLITQARKKELQYKMIDHYSFRSQPGEHTTEQELAYREVHHTMLKMLVHIPDRARSVYVLRQLEGMPVRDIAAFMKISEKTVKHHLRHARQKIKAQMKDN
jgi:RNA polymerase sigma-70 factor (ECF subfamily)